MRMMTRERRKRMMGLWDWSRRTLSLIKALLFIPNPIDSLQRLMKTLT
jgi:hypothetical protein